MTWKIETIERESREETMRFLSSISFFSSPARKKHHGILDEKCKDLRIFVMSDLGKNTIHRCYVTFNEILYNTLNDILRLDDVTQASLWIVLVIVIVISRFIIVFRSTYKIKTMIFNFKFHLFH